MYVHTYTVYTYVITVSQLMMLYMSWMLGKPRRENLTCLVILRALIQSGSVKHRPSSVKAEQEGTLKQNELTYV